MDLNFSLIRESDGGFWAACRSHGILAHGTTWGELCAKIWDEIYAGCLDHPALANVCFRPMAAFTPCSPVVCQSSAEPRPSVPGLTPDRAARSKRPKPGL